MGEPRYRVLLRSLLQPPGCRPGTAPGGGSGGGELFLPPPGPFFLLILLSYPNLLFLPKLGFYYFFILSKQVKFLSYSAVYSSCPNSKIKSGCRIVTSFGLTYRFIFKILFRVRSVIELIFSLWSYCSFAIKIALIAVLLPMALYSRVSYVFLTPLPPWSYPKKATKHVIIKRNEDLYKFTHTVMILYILLLPMVPYSQLSYVFISLVPPWLYSIKASELVTKQRNDVLFELTHSVHILNIPPKHAPYQSTEYRHRLVPSQCVTYFKHTLVITLQGTVCGWCFTSEGGTIAGGFKEVISPAVSTKEKMYQFFRYEIIGTQVFTIYLRSLVPTYGAGNADRTVPVHISDFLVSFSYSYRYTRSRE